MAAPIVTRALEEELICSICLSVYAEPVSLTCGHSFCKACAEELWQSQEAGGRFSCPECRVEFGQRPAPSRNVKLCSIVEQFQKVQVTANQVWCDFCLDQPLAAAKTCLNCETSLCDLHLQKHLEKPALKHHHMVEATLSLADRKCPEHQELLRYYCSNDGVCACVTCYVAGAHRNHDVKTLKEAHDEKRAALSQTLRRLNEAGRLTDGASAELADNVRAVEGTGADMRDKIAALYREIGAFLGKRERETLDCINAQESDIVNRLKVQQEEVECRKRGISKALKQLQVLYDQRDPVVFFKEFAARDPGIISAEEHSTQVTKESLDMKMMSVMVQKKLEGVAGETDALLAKHGFHTQGGSQLTFDLNTANRHLVFSNDLKTVSWKGELEPYPNSPERFEHYSQVLCSQGFSSGCYYFEVEIPREHTMYLVGITYKEIKRKENRTAALVGFNNLSWSVFWRNRNLIGLHNSKGTPLTYTAYPCKIGIWLDYDSGVLSFYQVADTLTHLCTFETVFTDPVFLGVCIQGAGSFATLC
eukprot:gi/632939533/ref/XP_007910437.1/ PREDICTED: E3 ubiquitin-protein ligase TRIM62-like [Callorhinchus milii]